MRIALLAPPFIPVPPRAYGGTELFVACLARGLTARGHDVVVYANGESQLDCRVRWLFEKGRWPPTPGSDLALLNFEHSAWAFSDALRSGFDVIHVNDAVAVPLSGFERQTVVHTLHHPHEPQLSALYHRHPSVTYVAISGAQRRAETMPRMRTIHHGIDVRDYTFRRSKERYLAFVGRMVPEKGAHLAIEVARRVNIPIKLAGEVQPLFTDYWNRLVLPGIDGRLVQFLGEVTLEEKNALLAGASALLFPIQWDEPFGLIMIEAMACGTPVLAFGRGAAFEVVHDSVSGWICRDLDAMAERAVDPAIEADACRAHVEERFSLQRMARDYEELYSSCCA